MTGLAKVGYFLIGLGAGIIGSSVIYARELDKPVGEVEEYIPLEDRDNDIPNSSKSSEEDSKSDKASQELDISTKEGSGRRSSRQISRGGNGSSTNQEFQTNQSEILNFYNNPSRNVSGQVDTNSFEKRNKTASKEQKENKGRRYSKMYKNSLTNSDEYQEPIDSSVMVDHPEDDIYDEYEPEIDLHDEYNLERIEPGFEVFLDDNPQDFTTVIFYEGDNTLCDDGEQIIPNPEEVVGFAALQRLIDGGPGAENNVIFVHNMKSHINYEVVLDAGMYSETVLGMFESRLDEEADKGGLNR